MVGIEPTVAALPKQCSTNKLHRQIKIEKIKVERHTEFESVNQPWKGRMLPLHQCRILTFILVPPEGFEPPTSTFEALHSSPLS